MTMACPASAVLGDRERAIGLLRDAIAHGYPPFDEKG
jgi:hypothetical protein